MELYDQLDHYRILGVRPEADVATIKQAFRTQARVCHPDCGGSDAAMQQVNLAWDILSNPEMRQRYDQARSARASRTAQAAAESDYHAARQRAASYPRESDDLDHWLDQLTHDFRNAQYGSSGIGWWGIHVPTVKGSATGAWFIALGGILGFILGAVICANIYAKSVQQQKKFESHYALMTLGGLTVAGTWLGSKLHQGIGSSYFQTQHPGSRRDDSQRSASRERSPAAKKKRSTNPSSEQTNRATRILVCPSCQRRLSVPILWVELAITCPVCSCRFPCPPPPPK